MDELFDRLNHEIKMVEFWHCPDDTLNALRTIQAILLALDAMRKTEKL